VLQLYAGQGWLLRQRETSVEALEGISTRHRHASTCIKASRDEVRRLLYAIRGDPAVGNFNSARSLRAGLLSGLARRAGDTLTGRQRSRHNGISAVIAARGEWWLPCAPASRRAFGGRSSAIGCSAQWAVTRDTTPATIQSRPRPAFPALC